MISADEFISAAASAGFGFYTGVPCSYLAPLFSLLEAGDARDYVGAASEGEAIGIAAGAWLAGRLPVVLCQNSGLGNAINPLVSLSIPFRIPALIVIGLRGWPDEPDEPQHALMGRITGDLLSLAEIPYLELDPSSTSIADQLQCAAKTVTDNRLPFALTVKKGDLSPGRPAQSRSHRRRTATVETFHGIGRPRSRAEVLEQLLHLLDEDSAVIATTGHTSRELFTLADREQHFYQVGSMGCAAGIGLGVALYSHRRTVIIDGDGAALMKLGTLATIGSQYPQAFVHLILDNGIHASTGGQSTAGPSTDFGLVAVACGYAYAASCYDLEDFRTAWLRAMEIQGPVLIHMRITAGSLSPLGRPTLSPEVMASRFKAYLTASEH